MSYDLKVQEPDIKVEIPKTGTLKVNYNQYRTVIGKKKYLYIECVNIGNIFDKVEISGIFAEKGISIILKYTHKDEDDSLIIDGGGIENLKLIIPSRMETVQVKNVSIVQILQLKVDYFILNCVDKLDLIYGKELVHIINLNSVSTEFCGGGGESPQIEKYYNHYNDKTYNKDLAVLSYNTVPSYDEVKQYNILKVGNHFIDEFDNNILSDINNDKIEQCFKNYATFLI